MKSVNVRKATLDELDAIFRMGYDVWGKGSEEEYLKECRSSAKYARGEWYILETKKSELASCLIVYLLPRKQIGLGSLVTSAPLRHQGFAKKLISEVLLKLELENPSSVLFLYSDIDPKFYEQFQFRRVPLMAQRYETTVCMVKGKNPNDFTHIDDTPEYF